MLMSAIKILEQPRRHRILYSYVRSMYALCLRGMIMNASLINCQWLQKGIAHWEKFARRFYNSTISSLNQRNTEGFSDQYCLKNIFHDANLILKTFAFICIYLIFFFCQVGQIFEASSNFIGPILHSKQKQNLV